MKGRKQKFSAFICFALLVNLLFPLGNAVWANTSTPLEDIVYDFEDGTLNGWINGWGDGFDTVDPIVVSTDLQREDNMYALRVNTDYAGSEDWEPAAIVVNHGVELKDYNKLTFEVYVPVDFAGTLVVDTAANDPWLGLDTSHHTIADLASSAVTINELQYVKINKSIFLPSDLSNGQLVIQLAKQSAPAHTGPLYVDNIVLHAKAPVGPSGPSEKYEAEQGVLSGDAIIRNGPSYDGDLAGNEQFSGDGYVYISSNTASITFEVETEAVGLYDLKIAYATPFGAKQTSLSLNNESFGDVAFPEKTSFTEISAGKLLLKAGKNTIKLDAFWGWYLIDYISIAKSAAPAAHQVEKTLVNPNATTEAQALMNYLVDQYGNSIISGQQDLEEAEWIYEQTGKYPAILSHDLIEYSPSRVENGSTSNAVEDMIHWAEEGGIIALCWHWNAPTGIGDNTPGKEWWRGFYTEHTTFDVKAALDNPSSDEYQLLLRDIDAIAVQLERLQEKNIPVLWRPLHEAEGGWFWWGAKGAESAKQLYRLMYDRLTNVHELNNLIWVWNSPSEEWYPGDDVVDINSQDIYNPAGDYSPSISKYEQSVSVVNDKKLVALPENGPIPDPDLLQAYHARWSWFSTWEGDFIKDGVTNTAEHLQKVFNHDYVITRDELPADLATYGITPEPTTSPEPTSSPEPTTSPEPTSSPSPTSSPKPTSSSKPSTSSSPTTSTIPVATVTPTAIPTVPSAVKWKDTLKVSSSSERLSQALAKPSKPINDVHPNEWYASDIDLATRLGIIEPDRDNNISPQSPITREQFADIVVRSLELTLPDASTAQSAIAILEAYGIMKGYQDGAQHGDRNITRAEMATILARCLNYEPGKEYAFSDIAQNWAAASIQALAELEVVKGTGHTKFEPNKLTTKAEAVSIMIRLLKLSTS